MALPYLQPETSQDSVIIHQQLASPWFRWSSVPDALLLQSHIELMAFCQNLFTRAAVTLMRRKIFNPTMMMAIVVLVNKFYYSDSSIIKSCKAADRIAWTVFAGSNNRL